MKTVIFFILMTVAVFPQGLKAQIFFVKQGKISFERKINILRGMAEAGIPDDVKEKMPKYDISQWELLFDETHSLYKSVPKREEAETNGFLISPQDNQVFVDYAGNNRVLKKDLMDKSYLLNDTVPQFEWKILPEERTIAGYECRKAVTRIDDTVYVVAFFTNEILLNGGPEGFNGLPGMILGLAIPRYNTTWFATKVELSALQNLSITPPKVKKATTEKDIEKMGEASKSEKEAKKNLKKMLYHVAF